MMLRMASSKSNLQSRFSAPTYSLVLFSFPALELPYRKNGRLLIKNGLPLYRAPVLGRASSLMNMLRHLRLPSLRGRQA